MVSFELLSPGRRLPADYWTRSAPGTRQTEVEIGPGDGRFLIEAAQRDPSTAWVGLEIRGGLARKMSKRDDLPANLRIHHCDGQWVVENLVADRSIRAFHVYFPDPWWKKRHHKRRLFRPELAQALARCLEPGGSVYVISDVESAFREAVSSLEAASLIRVAWTRAADDPAQSSYERKYRRQRRRLCEGRFLKGRQG